MLGSLLQRGNISRDFIFTLVSRVAVTLAGAAVGIILARLLGPSEYGDFAFAYSAILLLLLFSKLGMDSSATKFVAEYVSTKKFGFLFGYLETRRKLLYLLSLGGIVLLLSIVALIDIPESSLTLLLAAIPTLVLLSQLHFDQGVLYGFQQTAFAPLLEGFFRAFFLCLFVAIWWWAAFSDLTAPIVLLLNGFSLVLVLFIGRAYLRRITDRYSVGEGDRQYETKRWFFTGVSHLLISCSHVILAQTDVFMLGLLGERSTVGLYAVAVQVSLLLLFFSNAVNPVITPRIAAAYSKGDLAQLKRNALLGTRVAFWGSLPILVLLLLFRKDLLSLLFGEEYVVAASLVAILLMAQLSKVISAPVGFVMTMTEAEKLASYVIGFAAVVNIVLNFILIPHYGAVGAAVATTCSALLWNVILIGVVRRRFGVLLLPIGKEA